MPKETIIKKKLIGHYVLCLDPSLTAFGYALFLNNTVVYSGCVKTAPCAKKLRIRKGDDRMRRVSQIANVLVDLFETYSIEYIVAELPHGSQNAMSAVALGLVSGMVQGLADAYKIGLEWYSEGESKQNLLGKQSATKRETIDAVIAIYGTSWVTNTKYIDEAVADSISIYYSASINSPIVKYLIKTK